MNGAEPSGTTAPIIVTAQLGAADQRWADALRSAHYPPERNHLRAHLTLFRHLPPSLAVDLDAQLAALAREARPCAIVTGPFSQGDGVAIAVRSDELLSMREDLAMRFERYLTPQDRAVPRLHITVQNKVTPAIARATLERLRGEVRLRAIEIAALACWHYRGGPWSPIRRYPFRGGA